MKHLKIAFVIALLWGTVANAHPNNSMNLNALGTGAKLTFLKSVNFPGNFPASAFYENGFEIQPRYIQQSYSCIIGLDTPTAEYDREIPAGTVLTVKSVTLDDNSWVPQNLRNISYSMKFRDSIISISCNGYGEAYIPTVGDFKQAFSGVFQVDYARPVPVR